MKPHGSDYMFVKWVAILNAVKAFLELSNISRDLIIIIDHFVYHAIHRVMEKGL